MPVIDWWEEGEWGGPLESKELSLRMPSCYAQKQRTLGA
jgi:hypothetical protein